MRSVSQTEPVVALDAPLARTLVVGQGQLQQLSGSIHWPGHRIKALTVYKPDRDCLIELFPAEGNLSEFLIQIPWATSDVGETVDIAFQLTSGRQQSATIEIGRTQLLGQLQQRVKPVQTMGDDALIAICMATYQPDVQRLTRQLESIVCQRYENWVLIISDDASPESYQQELTALANIDPRRIRLFRQTDNLGFYHNFERALGLVPDNAAFIAFADQDDLWYPDKLQKLVDALQPADTMLAYSDMRLVDEAGGVISGSYWRRRKNEYRDFETVFLANTVTGAASLFKRSLLERVLPFPNRIGNAFHDHWLACVAMTAGKLAYVDEVLYDYVQYDNSVIGHCDFDNNLLPGLRPKASQVGGKGDQNDLYRLEYLRLQSLAETLKLRYPEQANAPALNLCKGDWPSAFSLFKAYFTMRFHGRTTNHAELSLLLGFIRRRIQRLRG